MSRLTLPVLLLKLLLSRFWSHLLHQRYGYGSEREQRTATHIKNSWWSSIVHLYNSTDINKFSQVLIHYPLVNVNIAIENGPVRNSEFSLEQWWSCPSFCVSSPFGHGSKPWYPNVNVKIDGIYGWITTQSYGTIGFDPWPFRVSLNPPGFPCLASLRVHLADNLQHILRELVGNRNSSSAFFGESLNQALYKTLERTKLSTPEKPFWWHFLQTRDWNSRNHLQTTSRWCFLARPIPSENPIPSGKLT